MYIQPREAHQLALNRGHNAEHPAPEQEQLFPSLEIEWDQLEAVVWQMPDGVILAEAPSGRLVLANRQFEHIWQQSFRPYSSIQDYPWMGFHVDGRPYPPHGWPLARSILRNEVVLNEEIRILRGDDTPGTVLASSTPIADDDGRVVAALMTMVDITERKRAEDKQRFLLRAGEALASSLDYETILQTLAHLALPHMADYCAVYLVDEHARIQQVAAAHVDVGKEELLFESWRYYAPHVSSDIPVACVVRTGKPELVPDVPDEWAERINPSDRQQTIARLLRPRSTMIVPLSVRGRTIGAISFSWAESERNYERVDLRWARELARQASAAIDNARLYAESRDAIRIRDEFLYVTAKELRAPLMAIQECGDSIERRTRQDGETDTGTWSSLERMQDQTRRLDSLIAHLQEIVRLGADPAPIVRRWVDLGALVRRIVDEARLTERQRTLALHGPSEPVLVEGDSLRLEQVVRNLVEHAIEHSPDGGNISIRLERQGDRASMAISDPGIGELVEARQRQADVFFDARNALRCGIGGLGAGLYIVEEIVRRHGGTVKVDSRNGRAGTITVQLPAAFESDLAGMG